MNRGASRLQSMGSPRVGHNFFITVPLYVCPKVFFPFIFLLLDIWVVFFWYGANSCKFSSHSGRTYPLNSWRSFLRTHSEVKMLVTQSCLTLCDPIDCNPPGSSVHGIRQARILEWVALSFSRGSSQPRKLNRVSCNAG